MSQIPTYVTAVPNGTEKVSMILQEAHLSNLTITGSLHGR